MTRSRKLQYADRVALQQADQAIRKDVLRALVEIITNSNDSYARLEDAGAHASGEIIIDILRKHKNSLIRVRDFAEGMDDARMDMVVGTYGEATSGLNIKLLDNLVIRPEYRQDWAPGIGLDEDTFLVDGYLTY